MKVSQFTPSTQVLSSSEEPPVPVPTQFTVGPVGPSVPELGVAERKPDVKKTNTTRKTPITKKSAPKVARAVMEVDIFFIGKGLDKLFALRIGEMAKCGRLLSAACATKVVVYS
jgi:hypothetical protein